MALLFQKIHV